VPRLALALVVVLAILSVVGWAVFWERPALSQRQALEEETLALQAREQQLVNQRDQLLVLRDGAPALRGQLDRLSALIPPDPDQARLLELVQAAASASGVAFTSLAFTDPVAVVGAPATSDPGVVLGGTTVTGSMRATYFQPVDFLRRLEVASSRAVLVTDVGLSEGADGFPQLDATFSAVIYSLIEAPVVVDAAVPGLTDPVPPGEVLATPTPGPGADSSPTPAPTGP
jgi:hypothetical protein